MYGALPLIYIFMQTITLRLSETLYNVYAHVLWSIPSYMCGEESLCVLGRQRLLQELVVFQETDCVLWCYPIQMVTCNITRRKYSTGWCKVTEQWVPRQSTDRDTNWGSHVLEGENGRLGSIVVLSTIIAFVSLSVRHWKHEIYRIQKLQVSFVIA